MQKPLINEIIDDVYFEKLGTILTHLQNWHTHRNQVVSDLYRSALTDTFTRMEHNHNELKKEIGEFGRMLSAPLCLFAKIKKQDRSNYAQSPLPAFKQFHQQFDTVQQTLIDLSDFLSKFTGATQCELSELSQIYSQISSLKDQYDHYTAKQLQLFQRRKECIYSKKHVRKHFQLPKLLQLLDDLQPDQLYHNQLSQQLHTLARQQIHAKIKMYRDISDNLEYVSRLFYRCFRCDFLEQVKHYFKLKLTTFQNQFLKYNHLQLDSRKTDYAYKLLQTEFHNIFEDFLNEITIAQWKVLFSELPKQPCKKIQTERPLSMILTFDHKILLYKQEDRNITQQINLEDLKVTEATGDGTIELRNRKTKDQFHIQFSTIQKEDEFYLHYHQVAQIP